MTNQELEAICEADQQDRKGDISPGLVERDRARRKRVEELVAAKALHTKEDYFHAALVFQHGEELADYWQAHELAKKASKLGHRSGRWLAAAALDRWLMVQGKSQKYGTQYRSDSGRWELWQVDPNTTDAERAEWNVPPIAKALERTAEMNRTNPPHFGDNVLATLEIPGLRLEIVSNQDQPVAPVQPASRIEPLQPDEKIEELPGYLPAGTIICHQAIRHLVKGPDGQLIEPPAEANIPLYPAYCATDPSGKIIVSWHKFPISSHRPFVFGWNESQEKPPILEAVKLGSHTGICIRAEDDQPAFIIARADPEHCWMIGGSAGQPLEELITIAASLPFA